MAFALIVTRPDGTEFIDNDGSGEPPESKFTAALAVLRIFTEEGVTITVREAARVGRELLDGETGVPRRHHESGYVFKITEF
jgi:hypothetical protein